MVVTDDEERFQLAANAARRLVSQCLAHARNVTSKMSDRVASASSSSPYRIDEARALEGEHPLAFKQVVEHVEATSNALISHLAGLKRLLDDDTFHPLPAWVLARSIAEVSASCVWTLRPGLSSNERAARGYAALFFAVQSHISSSQDEDAAVAKGLRDQLVEELQQPTTDVKVEYRVKDGIAQEDVAQIFVGRGRARARAKVAFNYSQRVKEEIPPVYPLYSALSGVVHGEHASITGSWRTPDAYARVIGHVAAESTEAWSRSVHDWFASTSGSFLNEGDRRNLLRSIPEPTRSRFQVARGF